jgi:hypothetical protein
MRVALITLVILAVATAAASPAPAAPSGKDGACTQLLRFFYVKSADLNETISAHWNYDDGAAHKAVVDTTQTGVLHLANGKLPPRADRRNGHGYADFTELQRQCRIPDFRQGQLYDALPMTYTLHGTWSAGDQTGTCDRVQTTDRLVRGTFIRRSLDWHYPSVGFRWDVPTAAMPVCTFQAASPEGELVTRRLHDAYPFAERPTKQLTFAKKTLLTKTTLTLTLAVHGTKSSGDGSHWSYDLSGTVVLQRYRACSIVTLRDLLHGRRCYDPSYP